MRRTDFIWPLNSLLSRNRGPFSYPGCASIFLSPQFFPLVGLYIIMSSAEVFVPLCWVYILLCPLRRFLSYFVGSIYYSVLFGGLCPTLLGLYIVMSSSEVFCPLRRFLSQRVLGCSLVCLAFSMRDALPSCV